MKIIEILCNNTGLEPCELLKRVCDLAGSVDFELEDNIEARATGSIPDLSWLFDSSYKNYTGREFPPESMTTDHLINTLKYLERRAEAFKACYEYAFIANFPSPDSLSQELIIVLKKELDSLVEENAIDWLKRMPVYIALDSEYRKRLQFLKERLTKESDSQNKKRTLDPVKMCQLMKGIISGRVSYQDE